MKVFQRLRSTVLVVSLSALFINCATTNYYTARTMDFGEKAISAGADNLILYNPNSNKDDKIHFAFSPSFGLVYGLPYRIETGIRLYVPSVLEGMIRYQINPKEFKAFDISANFHFGIRFWPTKNDVEILDRYLKYGFTISKEISEYQPYLSYYQLYPKYPDKYMADEEIEKRLNSILSIGIAIPYKGDFLFPEINYQFRDYDLNDGILFFGFGLRGFLNSKRKKTK